MWPTINHSFFKIRSKLLKQIHHGKTYKPLQIANALYHGILDRTPDNAGLHGLVDYLESGGSLDKAVREMVTSSESTLKRMQEIIPAHTLPDLTRMFPQYFRTEHVDDRANAVLFHAKSDTDFNMLEEWIHHYRYYDVPGVWGAKIDTDKKATAAIVQGLGAKSCLELGCFTGAVLSLLKDAGVQVTGLDASHLAFVLAYPNVRDHMLFGDLLTTDFTQQFDVVLAMDILEHLNPVKFDRYLEKIRSLVSENGYVYLNSPMFGTDDVFGTVFPPYLDEWKAAGDASYWKVLDCDDLGWPKHGHLVWASPAWWERAFRDKGLVRDREIESAIHKNLKNFFDTAPGRKCFFVLKHSENRRRTDDVIRDIANAIHRVDGLH